MGPSGSRKSTMMHILGSLDHPTEGSVSIEGADITKLNDNELTKLRREHIGDFGQTIVMVTHDARAAAIASRVLFLADGCIANELKGADQSEIVGAVDAVSRQ
jgi:putative ABC transport system ATP-binding protein